MPIGESAGAIFVTIDGDATPLLSKYAQVEAASRAAGSRIGNALVSPILDSSGRAQAAVTSLGGALSSQLAPAAEKAAVATTETASAIRGMGTAAGRSVTEIQATSGALRTLEGGTQGSIRAAERFLTLLPGVGAALQSAFPIIGAIALGEILLRAAGKFGQANEADQAFRDGLTKTDDEIKAVDHSIENLNIRLQGLEFGPTAGKGVALDVAKANASDADLAVKAAQQKADFLKAQADQNSAISSLASKGGPVGSLAFGAVAKLAGSLDPKAAAQAAQLAANEVVLAQRKQVEAGKEVQAAQFELDNQKTEDAKKAATAAEKSADEQREVLEASADYWGQQQRKTEEAQRRANEVAQQSREQAKKVLDGKLSDLEEFSREQEGIIRATEQSQRQIQEQATQHASVQQRTGQLAVQGQGVGAESANEAAKLLAQQQYALQIVHSKQQEVEYARQLASFDEKALQIKISIAQMETIGAILEQNRIPTKEGELKIAEDELKIEQAKAALLKQQIEDATKIQGVSQSGSLASILTQQGSRIPQALGSSLASGVIDGKGIGRDIRQSLTGIGKEMLGSVFDKLITQIATQTGVTAALNTIMGVHTAVTAANTTVVGASTLSTLANTVSTDLNTFWLAVKGFLGFASGGRPTPGVPYIVGEKGPELRVDDGPGVIIPGVPSMSQLNGLQSSSSFSSSHSTQALSIGALHIHGVQNAEALARALPRVLKTRAPNFSPATS
jgi:hypothetical protein